MSCKVFTVVAGLIVAGVVLVAGSMPLTSVFGFVLVNGQIKMIKLILIKIKKQWSMGLMSSVHQCQLYGVSACVVSVRTCHTVCV